MVRLYQGATAIPCMLSGNKHSWAYTYDLLNGETPAVLPMPVGLL